MQKEIPSSNSPIHLKLGSDLLSLGPPYIPPHNPVQLILEHSFVK